MLIVPTIDEWESDFGGELDFEIFNAGDFHTTNLIEGVGSGTCPVVNLSQKKMTILGTQYAGEMKKGLFGIANYLYPRAGHLSLHCSANEGAQGDTTLLFGLSGTGKTTLSADPKRKLIGDDETAWTDKGIFNLEGGCYAKCIDLSLETEPDIYKAIKFGTVLENIKFTNDIDREVNYHDVSITENTRASYPLEYIENVKIPAVGGHPKNIIFLTCDAYGVLPPVSKLTPEQAMYHFITGYTAKVAGTEMGIVEPVPNFSSCFGRAFLPLHPTVYATGLAKKMKEHNANAWFVNTGWSGGPYGVGKRMSLKITRSIVDAIHDGSLEKAEYENFPVFNLAIPKSVNGVDSAVLNPKNTWSDKAKFDETLKKLGGKFEKNFKNYDDFASEAVKKAGPHV
jgi:phosphoenolpyruvate carboxykinase (ATP)